MKEHLDNLLNPEGAVGQPSDAHADFAIRHFSSLKKIDKPWGYELWLSDGTETPYAMKILYLKKGMKTSLHFHKQKSEHNCIFSGTARMSYEAKDGSIQSVVLTAGNLARVMPRALHRVEALTDVVLFEASSPQLDDVIRVADDTARGDGKIVSEHREA